MTRAELLLRRAELLDEMAQTDRALADLEARAERQTPASGWVNQSTSPLGRRAHLAACRGGLPHRALGKRRLVRVDDLDRWLAAHDTPRRRPAPVDDLAAAFGVVGSR